MSFGERRKRSGCKRRESSASRIRDRLGERERKRSRCGSRRRHSPREIAAQVPQACDRALRLSPFDPLGFWFAVVRAIAHLLAGRFEQAIEWADRALQDQPRYNPARRCKIAANAHLGRLAEARAELGRMLAIDPGATIARYRASVARSAAPEYLDVVSAGLRLAGLPEG